jgi:hypothetical protein
VFNNQEKDETDNQVTGKKLWLSMNLPEQDTVGPMGPVFHPFNS